VSETFVCMKLAHKAG